tara:strand:- start:421 stop:663 length:243 start_codon:yes stop_codon:yes gene_type:complete
MNLINKKDILILLKKVSKKKIIKINSNLIKDKILDSLDLINLVFFIEDKYKIKFDDHELNDNNFKDIQSLTKLINKKIEK